MPGSDLHSGKVSPVNQGGVGSSPHVAPELGGSPKVNTGPRSCLLKAEVPTRLPGTDTFPFPGHDGDVTTARVAEDVGAQRGSGTWRWLRSPPLPSGISPRCVPGSPPSIGWGISAQRFSSAGEERAGQDLMEFSMGGNQESPACLV